MPVARPKSHTNAPDWLRTWVQHNFRRTQLRPSREKNISSLGTAIQYNLRRTQLLPSMYVGRKTEVAWALRYSINSGARNYCHLGRRISVALVLRCLQHNLAPKYIGCQAKRQRVQWDPQRVQSHPLHPPGYGPEQTSSTRTKADQTHRHTH